MTMFSNIPFSKDSEYSAEFVKKKIQKRPRCFKLKEDLVLIADPFPLNMDNRDEKIEEMRLQVQDKCQAAQKLLKQPLDMDVVHECSKHTVQSEYTIAYSKEGYGKPPSSRRVLPDGWVTPQSIQQSSYRQPDVWFGQLPPAFVRKEPDSYFKIDEKEREILGVKTGESDYGIHFNKLADWIIEQKLYGDCDKRPQFDEEDVKKIRTMRREN